MIKWHMTVWNYKMFLSPLDTTNLNLRSSKWWPPDLPPPLPPPVHYGNIAPEVKQRIITVTSLQHNVQRHLNFLKKDFSLRGWEEYESSFYPTYLRERGQSFNTDPTSLWKTYNCKLHRGIRSVSYTISREHQAHLGFLGEEWGNVKMDFTKMLIFWFKNKQAQRSKRNLRMCCTFSVRSEGQWR